MRYFLTGELFLLLTLRDCKEKVFSTDLSGLYINDIFDIGRDHNFRLIEDLEKRGLIKFKSIYIYYTDLDYIDDYFLNKYSKLLKEGHSNRARGFAVDSNLAELNKTIDTKLSLKQIKSLFSSIFNFSKPRPISKDFFEGLSDMLEFEIIIIRKHLEKLLDEYLENYRQDKLEGSVDSKEYYGRDGEYIKQDFYRYKKQRKLLIQSLLRKLEVQKPENVKISSSDISPEDPENYLNKVNFIELCLSAEKEGLIKIPNFNSSHEVLVNVDEDLLEATAKREEIEVSYPSSTPIISPISLNDYPIEFVDEGAILKCNGFDCSLPPYKSEHYLCRVMFSLQHPIKVAVDWSEIFQEMEQLPYKPKRQNPKKDMRSVQDTMYALNKRIKDVFNTNDDLLSWKNKSVVRNF